MFKINETWSQKPTICIHLIFVVTIELTLHIFLPQLLIQKVYLSRLQNEELSIHFKIYYAFTSTCSAVLYLDEGGITYYVTLTYLVASSMLLLNNTKQKNDGKMIVQMDNSKHMLSAYIIFLKKI